MLNFETFVPQDVAEDVLEPIPSPEITVIEADGSYGKIAVEPLPQGFGMTLGNPLRRVLYSSLSGTAVTWVKIEGILHEYATIPSVKEEVSELLMNIKGIRLRTAVETPGKLRLEVAGQGEVSAGDIMSSSDYEVVNPELHLATLDKEDAKLSLELNVESGTGYAEASHGEGLPIGVLPVDAIFTPIRKVNYSVDDVRVGQRTDFERLTMEVWTDGSVDPMEALRRAGGILVERFFLFSKAQRVDEDGVMAPAITQWISPEHYNIPVERLELSSRTLNCLKRAGIDKVGQVLEMKKPELLEIRNFGEKSLTELFGRLREMDLLPEELDPDLQDDDEIEDESGDEGVVEVVADGAASAEQVE
jgi:DNA-directed RNA polymerase subunit alpha